MALKNSRPSRRAKRYGYVSPKPDSKSEELNLTSSDSETGETLTKSKVREGYTMKKLMKEGINYKVDDDHIYTSVKTNDYGNRRTRTLKRNISEESDEKPKKQKCFSKNAVMARLNRERKKQYIMSLEAKNEDLQKENDEFRRRIKIQNQTMSHMKRENLYLKSLISNSKELSQILQNLRETTGLPVTSSLITLSNNNKEDCRVMENNCTLDSKVSNDEEVYHPRIRSVNCGSNFPIIDKDINLGSSSDKSLSVSDLGDLDNPPFDFENDFYDNCESSFCNNFLTDSLFNMDSPNFNLGLEESFNFDDSYDNIPDVGICLHVNQKRISVEICSICSSKATSSMKSVTDA